jgi:hypothetical protein
MKTRQMKTIGRLIEMKRRSVEAAEMAHAAAHAKSLSMERARIEADCAWLTALDAADHVGLVADLEYRDMEIRRLRRAVDAAEQQYAFARMEESACLKVMTEARLELRRFETWLENAAEAQKAEERRVERIAEDEVAARKKRAG